MRSTKQDFDSITANLWSSGRLTLKQEQFLNNEANRNRLREAFQSQFNQYSTFTIMQRAELYLRHNAWMTYAVNAGIANNADLSLFLQINERLKNDVNGNMDFAKKLNNKYGMTTVLFSNSAPKGTSTVRFDADVNRIQAAFKMKQIEEARIKLVVADPNKRLRIQTELSSLLMSASLFTTQYADFETKRKDAISNDPVLRSAKNGQYLATASNHIESAREKEIGINKEKEVVTAAIKNEAVNEFTRQTMAKILILIYSPVLSEEKQNASTVLNIKLAERERELISLERGKVEKEKIEIRMQLEALAELRRTLELPERSNLSA